MCGHTQISLAVVVLGGRTGPSMQNSHFQSRLNGLCKSKCWCFKQVKDVPTHYTYGHGLAFWYPDCFLLPLSLLFITFYFSHSASSQHQPAPLFSVPHSQHSKCLHMCWTTLTMHSNFTERCLKRYNPPPFPFLFPTFWGMLGVLNNAFIYLCTKLFPYGTTPFAIVHYAACLQTACGNNVQCSWVMWNFPWFERWGFQSSQKATNLVSAQN